MDSTPPASKSTQKQRPPKQAAPKGKAAKDAAPSFGAVSNRDLLQRMNFLYQSSAYLNTILSYPSSSASTATAVPSPAERPIPQGEKMSKRRQATTADLSREYIKNMKAVGRKSVMRVDPAVKRTICKAKDCDTVMIPGVNVNVRVHYSRNQGQTLSFICPTCGRKRRIPAPSHASPVEEDDTVYEDAFTQQQDVVMQAPPSTNAAAAPPAKPKKIPRRGPGKPPLFADKEAGHVVLRGKQQVEGDGDEIASWAC
ncbi:RNAse P Rpr2/Rpp21/SNM1 subunit domain-containing protein [Schizophyllum fasciatum]